MSTDDLALDLQQIASTGIIQRQNGGWLITQFAKRQAAVPAKERMLQMRERQNKQQYYQDVTQPLRDVTQNRTEQSRTETEKEGAPAFSSSFAPIEISEAITQWGNKSAQDAQKLYLAITDQFCIPQPDLETVEESLGSILDYYDHDIAKATALGKPVFSEWCNTRGKSGRNYSPTNTAWITKWLERLAPRPKVDTVDSIAQRVARDLGLNR
jgi:hypothetical protein